ncbi:MAG TPA: HAD family phosphatase [Candidatus Acidoferrales bacterium]|jgi:putative hydrolase of the HAD superfamily|nr:HAD family phosphatase [Candidatus Acidoferrales bacterium]
MAEVTTVFWDMGGVFLTNAWDRTERRRAIEKFQLDPDDFEDRHELMLDAFETGHASLEKYLERTVFYRPRPFTPGEFRKFMQEQSQACPEGMAVLEEVARTKKYFLAALNNESLEMNEYRIARFGLRDYFRAFFSSCFLGVRKPDLGIYRLALRISQRPAEECVFIDDRSLNLECARELGMRTILFQNAAQLRKDLGSAGVVFDGQ